MGFPSGFPAQKNWETTLGNHFGPPKVVSRFPDGFPGVSRGFPGVSQGFPRVSQIWETSLGNLFGGPKVVSHRLGNP
eukprot:3794605-Lingulodinium_polyedra.AAC.1